MDLVYCMGMGLRFGLMAGLAFGCHQLGRTQ